MVREKKPRMIISVGDALSRVLLENSISPRVLVVDGKVMRAPVCSLLIPGYETIKLRNSPGTISDDAWDIIASAIQHGNKVVVVDGEEDLLALVAIMEAPEKALVVYGQPREGMVVVEVTLKKKNEIKKILDSMEIVDSKS
jgi:hypothetical protein